MTLSGSVQGATAGALGFDADTVLSFEVARQFYDQGYTFCLRYISSGPDELQNDLSTGEANDILNAGLALMPVQHVDRYGWSPSGSLGTEHGTNAVSNAQAVGFPSGVNVLCDLEGINSSATAQDVIDYCGAWYEAVSAAGYVPGLYVGADAILNGDQLYGDLSFQSYWKSASDVPEVAVRGYQLIQSSPDITVNGIKIDIDTAQNDNRGGQAQWLVASQDQVGSC